MSPDSLNALQIHPVNQVVNDLASFLNIGRDWIAFTQFMSIAAGRMATPFHIDIVSDQWTADLMIADRIASTVPGKIIEIDTYKSFRAEEQNGFSDRYVLRFRRDCPKLHQDLVGFMARAADSTESAPSIWRVLPGFVRPTVDTPTLRLVASAADRSLNGFAASFASGVGSQIHRQRLAEVIESLCPRVSYPCSFRDRFSANLAPTLMLVVERLLQVFANIRRVLTEFRSERVILIEDYEAVRFLLVNLPLVPVDRVITAQSLKTAETIYEAVHEVGYQLALPDQSDAGHRWFTRNQASKWAELGYTTAKKYLGELEDDGVLVSTVDRNNREHGRVIHYRFADGRSPPFGWGNPFALLPDLTASLSRG